MLARLQPNPTHCSNIESAKPTGVVLVIIVMGVSGAGKTTVGQLLASQLGWEYADADDFHPRANIKKMRSGIPLTDEDRIPWLSILRGVIAGWIETPKNSILACSALKRAYREILQGSPEVNPEVNPEVRFVYLRGTPELLRQRLHQRVGHFHTERMLESQLATLEERETALLVDIDRSPEEIVGQIRTRLGLAKGSE